MPQWNIRRPRRLAADIAAEQDRMKREEKAKAEDAVMEGTPDTDTRSDEKKGPSRWDRMFGEGWNEEREVDLRAYYTFLVRVLWDAQRLSGGKAGNIKPRNKKERQKLVKLGKGIGDVATVRDGEGSHTCRLAKRPAKQERRGPGTCRGRLT